MYICIRVGVHIYIYICLAILVRFYIYTSSRVLVPFIFIDATTELLTTPRALMCITDQNIQPF